MTIVDQRLEDAAKALYHLGFIFERPQTVIAKVPTADTLWSRASEFQRAFCRAQVFRVADVLKQEE